MTLAPKRRWFRYSFCRPFVEFVPLSRFVFLLRVRRTLPDIKAAAQVLLSNWPNATVELPGGFYVKTFPEDPEVICVRRGHWRTTVAIDGLTHKLPGDGLCFVVVAGNSLGMVEYRPDGTRPESRNRTYVGRDSENVTIRYGLENWTELESNWYLVRYTMDFAEAQQDCVAGGTSPQT